MPNVTLFRNSTEVTEPVIQPIENVLGWIKEGRWADKIEQIRSAHFDGEMDELKKKLPCVLYTGEFTNKAFGKNGEPTYRMDECLSKHSGMVPIDIDEPDDGMEAVFERFTKDQFIHALWKSPSGFGFHGLIKIGDGKNHKRHYNAIIKKYKILDTTSRNPSRILFVSHDPDLYYNKHSSVFYDVEDDTADVAPNGAPSISGVGTTDYRKVDVAAKMVRLAPDGEKHNILLKAAVLLGGYVAAGKVEYDVAENVLYHEVTKRNIVSAESARHTIRDGLNYGMMAPIHETEKAYNDAVYMIDSIEDELGLLSNPDEDELYIRMFRQGLIETGKGFGYEKSDQYLVLKEAEFYAFVAHSNVGKTTFILWLIMTSAVLYNWNWMIYTGENNPASVRMRLIEFLTGRKIKDVPEHWLKYAIRFVNDHFYLISNNVTYDYLTLLNFAESLSKHKSLKGLFIDPYNSLKANLTSAKNKHQYDYEAYSDMLAFTNRTRITLFLSTHTVTEAQRTMDKDGNQAMPHATMVEGGSALYNKCHNFVAINRKIKDPELWMFTEVSVDKVRNKETGGEPTPKAENLMFKMHGGVEFAEEGRLPFDRAEFLPRYDD